MKKTALLLSLSLCGLTACGQEDPGFTEGQDKGDVFGNETLGASCSLDITCASDADLVCRPFAATLEERCLQPGEAFDYCLEDSDCADGHSCLGRTVNPAWPLITTGSGICVAGFGSEKDPLWQVSGVSAKVAQTYASDIPDPFLAIIPSMGNSTYWRTDVIANTYTPVWNEPLASLPQSFLTAQPWTVVVVDKNGSRDKSLGWCTLSITPEMLHAGSTTIAICGDYITDLQLTFAQL